MIIKIEVVIIPIEIDIKVLKLVLCRNRTNTKSKIIAINPLNFFFCVLNRGRFFMIRTVLRDQSNIRNHFKKGLLAFSKPIFVLGPCPQ